MYVNVESFKLMSTSCIFRNCKTWALGLWHSLRLFQCRLRKQKHTIISYQHHSIKNRH